MKVSDLEEQQGRNIYLSLSKYLSPCCREQRPLFKKMLLTLYGPMTGITFQLGPITTYYHCVFYKFWRFWTEAETKSCSIWKKYIPTTTQSSLKYTYILNVICTTENFYISPLKGRATEWLSGSWVSGYQMPQSNFWEEESCDNFQTENKETEI